MSVNDIGEFKINFILKWKCSEKELLEKCRACENYYELIEVLNDNMISSCHNEASAPFYYRIEVKSESAVAETPMTLEEPIVELTEETPIEE